MSLQARQQRSRSKILTMDKMTTDLDPEADTICYRGQTLALVRHFFEISSQVGRLPSILGREFFRAKVSHERIPSFEDQALFVHDIENALGRLSEEQREIITVVGLYDVSHREAAAMLHCSEGWISRRFADAIAALTAIFLEIGLLNRNRPDRRQVQMKGRPLPAEVASLPPKKGCVSVRRIPRSLKTAYVRRVPRGMA